MARTNGRSFRELVLMAYSGQWRLPAFQREWRWGEDQVIRFYNDLRRQPPIGALLVIRGETWGPGCRGFEGAMPASELSPMKYLVIDGQQRLTAGIHLFHATGEMQYYLSLDRVEALLQRKWVNLTDNGAVAEFVEELDAADGYVVARQFVPAPSPLLASDHCLCTSILAKAAELDIACAQYVQQFPEKGDLMYRVIRPHFGLAVPDEVPIIEIDTNTPLEAVRQIYDLKPEYGVPLGAQE